MPEITFAASPVPMKVASKVLGMKPDTIRNQMERGMLQIGVIKLPNWAGYWAWENDEIIMHTKEGTVMRLLDTQRPEYTFDNMASDEFMIADTENTPILGGKARMSFGDALKLVKRGMGMRLPNWKPDVVIRAQFPDENSKMTAPYLYVESRFGRVPWKETMIELFSEEWEVVD